jgi:DNA repair protein RecO (recombination protein O)
MPKILRTDAICLRSVPWRETSKLVTVFTQEYGKLVLKAKGARRPKSKFGAALEVMTLARVIFYKSERHLPYTLSDTEILEDYAALRSRPPALRAASVALEFTNRVFEAEVPNPQVFRLLRDLLRTLESGTGDFGAAAFAYLFRATGQIGYAPQLSHCVVCRRPKAAAFSARRGGLLCGHCIGLEPDALRVNAGLLRRLRNLYYGSYEQNLRHPLSPDISSLVIAYLQFHLERFELKTLRFIAG